MGKFILFVIIIMTIASLVYSASLKKCEIKTVKSLPVEVCEPTTPMGKFMKEKLGIII